MWLYQLAKPKRVESTQSKVVEHVFRKQRTLTEFIMWHIKCFPPFPRYRKRCKGTRGNSMS